MQGLHGYCASSCSPNIFISHHGMTCCWLELKLRRTYYHWQFEVPENLFLNDRAPSSPEVMSLMTASVVTTSVEVSSADMGHWELNVLVRVKYHNTDFELLWTLICKISWRICLLIFWIVFEITTLIILLLLQSVKLIQLSTLLPPGPAASCPDLHPVCYEFVQLILVCILTAYTKDKTCHLFLRLDWLPGYL